MGGSGARAKAVDHETLSVAAQLLVGGAVMAIGNRALMTIRTARSCSRPAPHPRVVGALPGRVVGDQSDDFPTGDIVVLKNYGSAQELDLCVAGWLWRLSFAQSITDDVAGQ